MFLKVWCFCMVQGVWKVVYCMLCFYWMETTSLRYCFWWENEWNGFHRLGISFHFFVGPYQGLSVVRDDQYVTAYSWSCHQRMC
jgi:hypothetical protein